MGPVCLRFLLRATRDGWRRGDEGVIRFRATLMTGGGLVSFCVFRQKQPWMFETVVNSFVDVHAVGRPLEPRGTA